MNVNVNVDNDLRIACLVYTSPNPMCTLLFTHATGFVKEMWKPIIDPLYKADCAVTCIALDMRNHGDSALLNASLIAPDTPCTPIMSM
jgi:pimeloyl-ACP methyl ester carboxylesterase